MTEFGADRIRMRATAMRLAAALSILDLDSEKRKEKDTRFARRTVFLPPALSKWPEIDVDYLMPENVNAEILYDNGSSPAIWPLNHACAFPISKNSIRLVYAKTLNPRKVRGIARRFGAFNVEIGHITIDENGSMSETGGGAFMRVNNIWINMLTGGNYSNGATGDRSSMGPGIVIGMALKARYEWSAIFRFPSGISLRFGCAATGVLALFKDRDAPEEGRRAALLHWVRQHWRRTDTVSDMREVRRHLRGVTKIVWRGMDVSVIPAEYDLEQVA